MNKDIVRTRNAAHKQSTVSFYQPKDKYAPREQTYFSHIHDRLRDEWDEAAEDGVSLETEPGGKDRRNGRPAHRPATLAKGVSGAKTTAKARGTASTEPTPSAPTKGEVTFEERDIDDLKPFPLQSQFWGQESQADDDRLEQRLRKGQTDRIPVMPFPNRAKLPKDTLLDGHRRLSLWKKLGTKRIKVIVRHDLADADAATVEAEFLGYNSYRELHIIDKARIAKRQFEIEKGRSRGGLRPGEDTEARERVGKVVGLCGRELQRYWRLLKAPREVQDAVRSKRLAVTLGEKVGTLTLKKQAEVAEHVRENLAVKSGNSKEERLLKKQLKETVQAYVTTSGDRRAAWHGLADFLSSLARTRKNLDGRLDEIRVHNFKGMKADLMAGRRLIDQIIPLADKAESDMD